MISYKLHQTVDSLGAVHQLYLKCGRFQVGLGWVKTYHPFTRRILWKNRAGNKGRAIELHLFRLRLGIFFALATGKEPA